MTTDQRTKLMAYWWPDACAAAGWNKNDRAKRLEVLSQAVGRTLQSASDLDHLTDIDKVKAHLLAISQPANLQAQLDQANMEKTRLKWKIGQLTPGNNYLLKVMRKRFGTDDWDTLSVKDLTKLRNTMAARRSAIDRKRKALAAPKHSSEGGAAHGPHAVGDNVPF